MRASTRISITWSVMGMMMAALTGFLAYSLWQHEPMPETLEALMKPIFWVFLILMGTSAVLMCLLCADPLSRRVVGRLRHKSQ